MSFLFIQNELSYDTTVPEQALSGFDTRTRASTDTPRFDSTFTRTGYHGGVGGGNASFFPIDPMKSDEEIFWFHTHVMIGASSSSSPLYAFGKNTDSPSVNPALKIQPDPSGIKIYTRPTQSSGDSDALVLDSASSLSANDRYDIDVMINFASGQMEIYVDGVSVAKGSHSSIAEITADQMRAVRCRNGSVMSQIICTENIPTVGMKVITLNPDALSSDNTMSGNLSDFNGIKLTEAGLSTQEAGSNFFEYDDVSTAIDMSKYDIKAVSLGTTAVCQVGFAENTMQHGLRIDGTIHTPYDFLMLDTTSNQKSLTSVFETNPETGAPFTLDEINALEAGVVIGEPDLEIRIANNGSSNGWRSDANVMGILLGGKDAAIADALYYSNDSNYLRLSPKVSSGGWYGSTSARIHLVFEDGTYFVTNRISYQSSFGGR